MSFSQLKPEDRIGPTRISHETVGIVLFGGSFLKSFDELRVLILELGRICGLDSDKVEGQTSLSLPQTYSSIFSESFVTLLPAESSIGLVRSILKDSMQTLSISHPTYINPHSCSEE